MNKPTYRWDYQHANGTLAGYVLRFDGAQGKVIVPHFVPDAAGGFNKGALQHPRPLYGLCKALQAGSKPIFIVEGEKCASALQGLGLVAVASQGGSNAAHHTDWAPLALHTGPIYLLPDNDKAGEGYATKVTGLVNSPNLRIVQLPNLPAGGDVVDWLRAKYPTWDGYKPLHEILTLENLAATYAELLRLCEDMGTPPPAIVCESAIEQPLPLLPNLTEAMPYPVEALGPYLQPVALAVQATVGAPLAMCAQSVLAAATLAVQAHADVELPSGSRRPVSNFYLTLAASGERKSTCDSVVLAPMREREKELHKQREEQWPAYRNAMDSYEQSRKQAQSMKNKTQRDEALSKLDNPPEAPLEAMLTCTEPTFEGLTRQFEFGQPSLGIFSSEGGQFFGGHGMNEDNRLRSIAGYSNLWDGEPIRRVRRGDGSSLLDGRRLSVHLMMQPEVAKPFLASDMMVAQGFFSRFLVCLPPSTMGERWYKEVDDATKATLARYSQHMGNILRTPLPLEVDTRNTLTPRALRMNSEAKTLWVAFYNTCEKELRDDGQYADIRGFANKLPEQALRLAGVLALVENIHAHHIDAANMQRGIDLAYFYVGEAMRIAEAKILDDQTMWAEKVRLWLIERWPHEAISVPDLQRLVPFSYLRGSAERCKKVLAILAQHHWLIPISEGATINGLKRREAWRIHCPQSHNRKLSQR